MAIDKLYFSTVNYDWNKHPTTLLTGKNLTETITNAELKDYHTSVDDITYQNLYSACFHARELFLVDIDLDYVSKLKDTDTVWQMGRLFNEFYRNLEKVKEKQVILDLIYSKFDVCVANRKISGAMLWTAGCSYTAGIGVDHDQRWASILSKRLNLPESSLSKNGASIIWAADQILRSDINPGDTLIWGITTVPRVDYAKGWKLETGTLPNILRDEKWNLPNAPEYYTSLTHVVHCIRSILQVINFCKKTGVKLYIVNLLDVTWVPIIFKDHAYFLDLVKDSPMDVDQNIPQPIDLGTDNSHPGPLQHKKYAELIYNFIQKTQSK